jgi:hypothetical protein
LLDGDGGFQIFRQQTRQRLGHGEVDAFTNGFGSPTVEHVPERALIAVVVDAGDAEI